VTVQSDELKTLCRLRAQHHRERAKAYEEQLGSMRANAIEGMAYSGGDPKRALSDRLAQHAAQAREMDFIADHLAPNEEYRLDRDALMRLGIVETSHY
jgi:hypothetical protein